MNLIKNGLVLTFARLSNYVLMLVTPLFLVRMLDVHTYGQYREFLLYATVLVTLLGLSIKDNLTYTIPRYPDKSAAATTQTVAMLMATSVVGLGIFLVGVPWFLRRTSFDFRWPLALYVFFFLNFDVLEGYWIARQQPRFVLFYTSMRTLVRVVAVVLVTWLLHDLRSILYTIVALEFIKFLVCIVLLVRMGALTRSIDKSLLREQWRFILPLSGAGLLMFINARAGNLYVSTAMGATALAIYSVGTYQLPITAVVRSAVADTLFPEMVRHAAAGSKAGLGLWKRATVFYCVLVFPLFAVLFIFADQFVTTLFTDAYRGAVGVFRVSLLVMVRQCFEMGTPLRAMSSNRPVLLGNVFAIAINLPLLVFLTSTVGILGAALAWFAADLVISLFLARSIMIRYAIRLRELSFWREIAKLALVAIVPSPILIAANFLPGQPVSAAIIAACLYLGVYGLAVKWLRVSEIETLIKGLKQVVPKREATHSR